MLDISFVKNNKGRYYRDIFIILQKYKMPVFADVIDPIALDGMGMQYPTGSNSLMFAYSTLSIIVFVWGIICLWKIFKKADRPGRYSLVPIYNIYVLFDIAGSRKKFFRCMLPVVCVWFLWFVISILFRAFPESQTIELIKHTISRLFGFISLGFLILILIFIIIIQFDIAKKFGKSSGFGVGLLFLTPIFIGILAFGDAEYKKELN